MSTSDERKNRLLALGEVAAEIAHELRNALQTVSANVYLARRDPAASEPHLLKIERSARIAHDIVEDIMLLARGEDVRAEPVRLVDLLPAARELLPPPGADFADALVDPELLVRAHPRLVARLLHTLYENSIRGAAPRRARVETRGRRDGGRIVIEIADDGPGVPPEVAATVFEPLVSARAGGTGLGLALAKRIAEAHGGTITLVPCPVGATFRVELPA